MFDFLKPSYLHHLTMTTLAIQNDTEFTIRQSLHELHTLKEKVTYFLQIFWRICRAHDHHARISKALSFKTEIKEHVGGF